MENEIYFKQNLYIVDIRYVNKFFEYEINTEIGERREIKNMSTVKTVSENFLNLDAVLDFNTKSVNKLKIFLEKINDKLNNLNSRFSVFIKLYNEKVYINGISDFRKYGSCKVVVEDKLANVFFDEFSVDPRNLETLMQDILNSVEEIIQTIKNIFGNKKYLTCNTIPLVLSQFAAGYFIHEILGHSLESDFFSYYKKNFENLKISPKLTVIDSIIKFENIVGLNKYDDNGILIKPITVIKNGKLNNIFSIEEKASFDNVLYGFARRENYKTAILPRMRSTFIKPFDNINCKEIVSKYNLAIYFDKATFGGVNPETGEYFVNGYGFLIKNGEKQNFIRNLKLTGNLMKNLNSFDYIGNDFKIFGNCCSKLEQVVRVAVGGPTTSLSNMSIIGEIYGEY